MATALLEPLLAPGDLFAGRYRVLRSLGADHEVRDQATGETHRLRIWPDGDARRIEDDYDRLRFLSHRNLTRVCGFSASPEPHIVLEAVSGVPLVVALAAVDPSCPAHTRAALSLLCQLLDAVAYLHEHGIVLGGLPPEAVLVRRGLVKLTDLGIGADPAADRPDPRTVLRTVGGIFAGVLAGASEPDRLLVAVRDKLTQDDPDLGYQAASEALAHLAALGLAPFRPKTVHGSIVPRDPQAAGSVLFRPRLLGRKAELERGASLLDEAAATGEVRVLIVRGAAGSGKTRLLQAIRDLARERDLDAHLATCRGEEYVPYGDLAGLGGSIREGLRRSGAVAAHRQSLAALQHLAVIGRLPRLGEPDRARPLSGTERRLRALSGFHQVFSQLFADRGQVLLFDDWHRAEPRAVELIEMLLERRLLTEKRPRRGVVLVFSCGRRELKANPGADRALRRIMELRSPAAVELGALDREDAADLVRSMTCIRRPEPDFVSWLHEGTGGVPRALVEAIGVLDERGELARLAGGSLPPHKVEPLAPPVLAAPSGSTLSCRPLDPDERWLLDLLRVTRLALDPGLLAEVSGLVGPRLRRTVSRLRNLGILAVAAEGSLRLRLDARAEGNGGENERQAHRRWIEVLEPLVARGREDLLPYLGEHAERLGDQRRLETYLPLAAEWLARMHQLEAALALYARCRARLDPDSADPVPVAVTAARIAGARGAIFEQQGDYHAAFDEYRLMAASCDGVAGAEMPAELRVGALRGLAAMEAHRGDGEAAEVHARAAVRLALEAGSAALLAESCRVAARVYAVRSDWRRSLGLAVRALRASRAVGDAGNECGALLQVGTALLHRGIRAPAFRFLAAARERAEAIQDDRALASALVALGTYYWWNDELVLARATHEAAAVLRERIGDRAGLAYSLQQVGVLALEFGDLDLGAERLWRARETFAACRYAANVAVVDLALAECALRQGDRATARTRVEALIAAGEADDATLCDAWRLLAEVSEADGDRAAVVRLAALALERARWSGYERGEAGSLLLLARAGEERDAELEVALDRARRSGTHELIQRLAHHLAAHAEARGDRERARGLYDQALAALDARAKRLGRHRRVLLEAREVKDLQRDAARCAGARPAARES